MTWQTSAGDRYLTGAEAKLFQAALKKTLEELETNDLDCTDTMLEVESKKSRLHLFSLVGQYLLRPTADLAPLNAWTEGAVGLVFACLANSLDYELEAELAAGEDAFYWRDRMLAAAKEKGWRRTSEIGSDHVAHEHECLDSADWHHMLEFLEEQILWDMDWSVDPFGQLAGYFSETRDSYFQWQHRSVMNTSAAIELLGELCDYRAGEFKDDEVA